jgi:xylulokinase
MLAAGGSLQWFRNNLAAQEIAEARKRKIDPYELLIEQAQKSPPASHSVQFLPYLTGERCPHPDPQARGGWIGITNQTSRADLIRALLEGVTFGMRDALEIIRSLGLSVNEIRTTGGGARSPFWRQLQADIYDAPVIMTNAEEGPAYGAALLAGVGIKTWSSVEEACRACINPATRCTPNRKLVSTYQKAYDIYRTLYPTLKDKMHELAEL